MGLHRPDLATVAPIITIIAASLWGLDRLYRSVHTSTYFLGNYATLTPLHDGTTKVTLHRPLPRARPGSHAFLWIPGVRLLERHPFTLISRSPHVEFLVKGRDGFTRALHNAACLQEQTPNRPPRFRVSIEGPYGNPPDLSSSGGGYEKLLLVAGGSGVTFSLGLALAWAQQRRTPRQKGWLEFVWVVREPECFGWCEAELAELLAYPRVAVHLYVSGSSSSSSPTQRRSLLVRPSEKVVDEVADEKADFSRHTSLDDDSGLSTPDEKYAKDLERGLVISAPAPAAQKTGGRRQQQYDPLSEKEMSKQESIVEVATVNKKAVTTKKARYYCPPAYVRGRPPLAMHLGRVLEGVGRDGRVLVAGE